MDIEDIKRGANFTRVPDDTLDRRDVMLVMVGQNWLDPGNAGRLHDPEDFVRLEIEKALSRRHRSAERAQLCRLRRLAVADR